MHHNRCEYTHSKPEEKVTAIGGHYVVRKEVRLPFGGKEVLYIVADAMFDTTCCGFGGITYAYVPGFVLSWKHGEDASGRQVSTVAPVESEKDRQQIRRIIEKRESVAQVNFL